MNNYSAIGILHVVPVPSLTTRLAVVTLVLASHAMLMWSLLPKSAPLVVSAHEFTLNLAVSASPKRPAVETHKLVSEPQPAAEPIVRPEPARVNAATAGSAQNSTPSVITQSTDTEPEYKAAYLNNPPPSYPMAARRMGMQGKVILNVEVLADGNCGQITIEKSSGHAMLDQAALHTVKTWRFLPASRAGQVVDKWFMIPVQFLLKDHAA